MLSAHMTQHIVLMNLLAPFCAWLLRRRLPSGIGTTLLAATSVQMLLLWGWHAPPVLPVVMHMPVLHLAMQLSLFLAALWFWLAVLRISAAHSWRPVLALLVTSKLFCLLGVLLVFAPRGLYGGHAAIADQQTAGLLMIIACPATYLLAGLIVTARWFTALERRTDG